MRRLVFFALLTIGISANGQNAGQIGNNQTICYGSAPQALTFTIAPSGGVSPYFYRWERSNDGGNNWSPITGSTGSRNVYSPPVLGRSASFRCRVTDANALELGPTNPVFITVIPDLVPGTIASSQTIIYGDTPVQFTESEPATGGDGSYTYRWQISEDGLRWTEITGAESAEYAPPRLYETRWFRRWVSDGSCGSVAGNSVRIGVNPITLYTSENPVASGNESVYNMGTEFAALRDGYITSVRLYTHILEAGDHIVRIWMDDPEIGGYATVAGPFTWSISSGTEGWREFELPQAVAVRSGTNYIVSVSNGSGNNWYVQSMDGFNTVASNIYIDYLRGLYTSDPNQVPRFLSGGASFFRDVVFQLFTPGSISSSQSICYQSVPESLTEIEMPSGGTDLFTYQWQISPDSIHWSNIEGAITANYSPQALTATSYFRRAATSGNITAYSSPVRITVNPEFSLAQLHENITIFNNTSTSFNIEITGGRPPYTVTYELDGVQQAPITGYRSGEYIGTGVLSTGTYTYSLTSVTDAAGCDVGSLGSNITITVTGDYSPAVTNKALIITNNGSGSYSDYNNYIRPYLENFGIPYDVYNEPTPQDLPDLADYALIILGHRNIYDGITVQYPVSQIIAAVNGGVGLISFDPHFFDYSVGTLSSSITSVSLSASIINVVNTSHFITNYHADDAFNLPLVEGGSEYSNNYDLITLNSGMSVSQNTELINGTDLATLSGSGHTASLIEVSEYGLGRIVKWNDYDWVFEEVLGPVFGMDDILWRSIVWPARKPFVIKGMPPIVTMRVDDVNGDGGGISGNFQWLTISNEYGFIPWCGTFETIPPGNMPLFRNLLNNNLATASPHAFFYESSIYYNHDNLPGFNALQNTRDAMAFYTENSLPVSKFVLPHYYEIDPAALAGLQEAGVEFIGTHMQFGSPYGSVWLEAGPYRINRSYIGRSSDIMPVYYGGNVTYGGYTFFNCVTEIRDDDGYEWVPMEDDMSHTIAQGVRQLTRSLGSMVLTTLFTHQFHLEAVSPLSWRTMMSGITSGISKFNPEFRSMDYAVQYIRARNNIEITNVSDDGNLVNITYSGSNDMDTRCYLFTESGSEIVYKFVLLPAITSGSITVGVSK